MDDLTMVREAYGEITPDTRLQDGIRARLALEAQADGGAASVRSRPRRRRRVVTLGAIAAAAAVTAALTVTGVGRTPVPPAAEGELSARTILLAAAERAEAEPEGRFWRVHGVEALAGLVEGAEPYTVAVPQEWDAWYPRAKEGTDVVFERTLPARPLTQQDRATWERAGSPTSFTYRDGRYVAAGAPTGTGWKERRTTPEDLWRTVSRICAQQPDPRSCEEDAAEAAAKAPERRAMAADPSRFQEWLFPPGAGSWSAADKLQRGFSFLLSEAASAEIRAATFRLLADLPGVRTAKGVTTSDGRGGIAIAADGEMRDGSAAFQYTIIFEPKTYRLLGDRKIVKDGSFRGLGPGTLVQQTDVYTAGWTSEEPHHD
ncbi:hypothetical protein E1295_04250 [Nonomuraea mesophila]|uniref:CU044_5270 family protein n=1 Tax=Nonomuraea mesophila TaxID=2530382 RepID=A0A4R5FW73_9ACTN|nr:hypothetical protein [Nonomuraea mesophila]TDE58821.1 hypothetical protein E1295_04250 [Nonomuraea mesophila]